MCKILKRLFKRKKYMPIHHTGGYPTPTYLRNMVKSGECVVTKQQEAFTAHKRVIDALKEIEAKELTVTKEEVSEAVAKALGDRFRYLHDNMKHSITNCPNCGAALHGRKCDYCGTEQ